MNLKLKKRQKTHSTLHHDGRYTTKHVNHLLFHVITARAPRMETLSLKYKQAQEYERSEGNKHPGEKDILGCAFCCALGVRLLRTAFGLSKALELQTKERREETVRGGHLLSVGIWSRAER